MKIVSRQDGGVFIDGEGQLTFYVSGSAVDTTSARNCYVTNFHYHSVGRGLRARIEACLYLWRYLQAAKFGDTAGLNVKENQ